MKNILGCLPLLFILSCQSGQVNSKAEEEKLMNTSREWSRVAATDSVDKILAFWADDAVVMSPGQLPIKGKDSIRAMVVGSSKIPGFKISWEPISATISKNGDLGYLLEENQMTMNDSLGHPVTERNKALTIWRKEKDGSWKNIVDMWNALPSGSR